MLQKSILKAILSFKLLTIQRFFVFCFFSKAKTTKASGQSRHGKMQPAKLASGITVDELEEESPPSDGSSQKGAYPSQFKLFEAAFPSSNEKSLW